MKLQLFLEELKIVLNSKSLKGVSSHLKMSPKIDGQPYRPLVPQGKTRKSSVLLLMIGKTFEELNLLFTLRSSNVQHHKKQISFPGGHCEFGEDAVTTALREAYEEVGIQPTSVQVLGLMSELYVPPSETIIIPVVGYTESLTEFKINTDEVEETILFALEYFLNESNRKVEKWNLNGKVVDVPVWNIHSSVPLWGATAMILSEFVDIVNEILQKNE